MNTKKIPKKSAQTFGKTACIFLNGEAPSMKLMKKILKKNPFMICADGASNYLKKLKIIPNIILGDLDSIEPGTLKYYKGKTTILKILDQDTTDFEKALLYCKKQKIKDIAVMGVFNKRSDHHLNNYSVLKRHYSQKNIRFVDEEYEVFFIKQKISFNYRKNEPISLLAVPKATKIISTGLVYKLAGEDLEFGIREGTLNEASSKKISISFQSGDLLLFRKHFL